MKRFTPFFQPEMFAYWLLPLAYAWAYAPFGLNTTDGGFLTGLAWQVLSESEIHAVYVRPPIPVWLRSLEMTILPDQWAILGQRWVFFFKVAFYKFTRSSRFLWPHSTRWVFAVAAYIVSVHTYPPMAWHTIDGLMFGAMGLYFSFNANHYRSWWAAGCCIALAMLCKQSFYPLIGVVFLAAWEESGRKAAWMTAGGAIVWLLVASFWIIDGILSD